ncbi:MAG: hypothetical protein JWL61_5059 [Gemmatimonadetes bacterium]|nr:hypothetical protein [Gemmatimonadota bacterium]
MDSTIAGLIGAGLGSVAGLSGTVLAHSLQRRQERATWLRNKQLEAYSSTLRYVLRLLHKRSSITSSGQAVLGQEAIKEWFDDLAEIHSWLAVLTVCCSAESRRDLAPVQRQLSEISDHALQGGLMSQNVYASLVAAYDALVGCARRDLRINL